MTNRYEKVKLSEGFFYIIGCDEVGRACLAGPVVAGAVILDPQKFSFKIKGKTWYTRVRDSKLVTPEIREALSPLIKNHALAWGIGVVSEKIIDEINIHHASLLAMRQAVENLLCHCEGVHPTEAILFEERIASSPAKAPAPRNDKVFLFVDGKFAVPGVSMKQEAIINGDAKILSVAAASIIAKVYRDDLMRKLHYKYPIYNFARHKGYATEFHRKTIISQGISPIHRLSFCSGLL